VEKNSAQKLDNLAKNIRREQKLQLEFTRIVRRSIQNQTNFRVVYTYQAIVEINKVIKIINEDIYLSIGNYEVNIEKINQLRQKKNLILRYLREKENVRKTRGTKEPQQS
jgi:predicted transcriptional regulator